MPLEYEAHQAEVVKELGFFALKTLVTINAGAVVVLLAFIGNIEDSQTVVFDISNLKRSLFAFTGGLVMVFISVFVTYLSVQKSLAAPDHSDGSVSRFLFWMMAPPTISFAMFVLGVVFAAAGFGEPIRP